jgi:hypothetical protein
MLWTVFRLWTSLAVAIPYANLQKEESTKRRQALLRRQDLFEASTGAARSFEIGRHGEAFVKPGHDGEYEDEDNDGDMSSSNGTWTNDEHDTAPPPGMLGLDEEWNETEYDGADMPFFTENVTSTEPPTFDDLLHMAHAPRGNYTPSPPDSSTCKDTYGIQANDTREVAWKVAGVALVTHGEGRKYRKSCTFHMGSFPNGRLAECTQAIANSPVCSNNFHLDAKTYACDCVGKDLYPCSSEEGNSSCLYQLNPGEFDDEDDVEAATKHSADDASFFIREWDNADQF